MRFLALGDSYTIGEGVADWERWPNQLVQLLRARGLTLSDPHIVARTAWTTDELSDAITIENPRAPYELVSLLIGVNDQYRGRRVETFAAEFTLLVDRAIDFASRNPSRVIAISIPDWGATPFAVGRDHDLISREISAFNGRARELAIRKGANWVDVTETAVRMRDDPALVAPDGLHPSGEMYRQWAELILPTALSALGKQY